MALLLHSQLGIGSITALAYVLTIGDFLGPNKWLIIWTDSARAFFGRTALFSEEQALLERGRSVPQVHDNGRLCRCKRVSGGKSRIAASMLFLRSHWSPPEPRQKSSDLAVDCGSNDPELIHQFGKLLGIKRLRRPTKLCRDHGALRSQAHPRRQRLTLAPWGRPCRGARAVRGIGSHGQVRELLDDGDRRDIQRVAGVGFKCADGTLAQGDLIVPTRHDALGREQQLLQGRSDSALEQTGFWILPSSRSKLKFCICVRLPGECPRRTAWALSARSPSLR